MWNPFSKSQGLTQELLQAWPAERFDTQDLQLLADVCVHMLDLAGLALYQKSDDRLRLVAHAKQPEHQTPEPNDGDLAALSPAFEVRKQDLTLVSSLGWSDAWATPKEETDASAFQLAVPLHVGQRVVGVAFAEPSGKSPNDVLDQLAQQGRILGLALETTQVVQGLQDDLAREARRRQTSTTAALQATSADRLAVSLLAQCARSIGFDSALFSRCQQPTSRHAAQLSIEWHWNVKPAMLQLLGDDLATSLLVLDDIQGTPHLEPRSEATLDALGIRSVLAYPLLDNQELLGAVVLVSHSPHTNLRHDHTLTLKAFSEQLRLVLANAESFERFGQNYRAALDTAVQAVERGRPELRGHHQRVQRLAGALGREQGLDATECAHLETAAAYHDVGMLDSLRADIRVAHEFEHPTLGADLVQPLPDGPAIGTIIAEHHECHDGMGFPEAKSGADISTGGALLSAAEYVVERTTATAVAPAQSLQQTLESVQRETGRFSEATIHTTSTVLKRWIDTPLAGGDCTKRKSCPSDVCGSCAAATSAEPCWRVAQASRQCSQHGDGDCNNCYVFLTWGEGQSPNVTG